MTNDQLKNLANEVVALSGAVQVLTGKETTNLSTVQALLMSKFLNKFSPAPMDMVIKKITDLHLEKSLELGRCTIIWT